MVFHSIFLCPEKRRAGFGLLVLLLALSAVASELPSGTPPLYNLSAHVDLVSSYVVRGFTTTYFNGEPLGNEFADAPESEDPVLQWGADLKLSSGWYLGYFGSMINYSYLRLGQAYSNRSISVFDDEKSIEHDIYGGYELPLGDFTVIGGLTGYLYTNSRHAETLESRVGIGYGDFSLFSQTLMNDSLLGNAGDTYWTLNYRRVLPWNLNFNATLGWFSFRREGKFYGTRDTYLETDCPPGSAMSVTGCYSGKLPVSNTFGHVILQVSYLIPKLPVSLGVTGILGGYNRFGAAQENEVIGSISLYYE
ncbi:TorF family putative porin [Methylocaldum sp.]|uniref:TorF family putative porin n=1 Tax=Methylocaldum sp. TaxID=1969727 RepID=UPI002D5A4C45|nr:TorF family putative porin [Methylocaldum sp.]HYE38080.1 TorF family putative porin [Methylocaldum sp.]